MNNPTDLKLIHHMKNEIFIYEVCCNTMTYEIKIHFSNDQFDKVEYPFTGKYARNHWKVLAMIEQEISKLETESVIRPNYLLMK